MADTDSALKTQMFMSESARQNAVDLSARISAGFQAAGEATRFEGEISRSMVQSAAQFKQIQIDEWYKGEQVKLQQSQLALQEKNALAMASHRKAQLDAQNERANSVLRRQQAADEEKAKGEQYKVVAAEVDSGMQEFKAKHDLLTGEEKKLDIESSRIQTELSLIDAQVQAGKMSVGYAESYALALQESKQRLNDSAISIIDEKSKINKSISELAAIGPLAVGRARPVESLLESVNQVRIGSFTGVEKETADFLSNSGVTPNASDIKQASGYRSSEVASTQAPVTTTAIPRDFGRKDLNFWTDPSNKNFDPASIKSTIIPNVPEAEIVAFNNDINDIKTITSDVLLTTSPNNWEDMLKDMPSISKIDRWNAINPKADKKDTILTGRHLVKDRAQKVYEKAKELYFQEKSVSPEDRKNLSLNFDDIKPYIEKAKPFIDSSGNPNPTGVSTTPMPPGFGSVPIPEQGRSNINDNARRSEILSTLIPEGSEIDFAASGKKEQFKQYSDTLLQYEKELEGYKNKNDSFLAEKLSSLSDYELGFSVKSLSREEKMEAKPDQWWNPKPIDSGKARIIYIKSLIKSGKAPDILAASNVRRLGKDIDSARKIIPSK
jgi:C4-type Zn-finger protein